MSFPTKKLVIDNKIEFVVPTDLDLVKKLGSGAYGCVCAFTNAKGNKIAVKKITNAFEDVIDGKRILREVHLLGHFKHENIIQILDMYPPTSPEFDDIYIVTDLMETDLHKVIYSKQALTEEHSQYFTYQILRGLLYLHSAGVVHRDLKPANILVNKNCDLKICDFGLSRGFNEDEDDPNLTDYVVTRWYRAPEVVLMASEYTKAIDVWSVGCILCEMIGRKPIFVGKDHLDQIKKILEVIGTPSDADKKWLPKGPPIKFIEKCGKFAGKPWKQIYPSASSECITAIQGMLHFDPNQRISVYDCLRIPFFESLHMPDDEPVADKPVDWAFDKFQPTKRLLQSKIYTFVANNFHPFVAKRDEKSLGSRQISGSPPNMTVKA